MKEWSRIRFLILELPIAHFWIDCFFFDTEIVSLSFKGEQEWEVALIKEEKDDKLNSFCLIHTSIPNAPGLEKMGAMFLFSLYQPDILTPPPEHLA